MAKYLDPYVVAESFKQLGSKEDGGKTHLERTSAVLYFLTFDAVRKQFKVSELDLDPDRFEGKTTRKQFELEFAKLVLLDSEVGRQIQFLEFGKVDRESANPEKRVSANFLTVPLKKATTQAAPYYYPKRPKAPLLKLGPIATSKYWGVASHDDYEKNLFIMLNTAKSSTPAYDLSILVLRNEAFNDQIKDEYLCLFDQLEKKFTKDLALVLKRRIEREKIMLRQRTPVFVDQYISFVKIDSTDSVVSQSYEKMTRDELIARLLELETELKSLRQSN